MSSPDQSLIDQARSATRQAIALADQIREPIAVYQTPAHAFVTLPAAQPWPPGHRLFGLVRPQTLSQ